MNKPQKQLPADGLAGLKQNLSTDALSGFLVFLLALPLSLGIAKASEFKPIMGLVTAMIGGLVVALVAGSRLTIKGPAAGLIVIVAGSVAALGHGDAELGWHLALGAIVIAGLIQITFGLLKFGSFLDFFPLNAVHGMLAAIGIIIMSKQIHILLGVNPVNEAGKPIVEPLELLGKIPDTLTHINPTSALIGLLSLVIVFTWPRIKQPFFKKIPAPIVVLALAIPLGQLFPLGKGQYIHFDQNLFNTLAINASFDGLSQGGLFWTYVIMFALVGSLESLLTVKAIDILDPYKRKSNANKDLIAVGIGNAIAGLLGGLPMISEVARSSYNVNNGAKTRWANFFHGFFILVFLMVTIPCSDLIPNTALAGLLIGVGFRLAHPKEFKHFLHIGWDQLVVFVITIITTLATDLLIGVGTGILAKLLLQLLFGAKLSQSFRSTTEVSGHTVKVQGSAVFSNWLGLQKKITQLGTSQAVTIDFSECRLVDHSTRSNLINLKHDFEHDGGSLTIMGLNHLKPISTDNDPTSTLVFRS